jgi:hypothetical protein
MPVEQIGNLPLGTVVFPDRAGELQTIGATAGLINELGTNYARYHDFLAAELRAMEKRPDPDDFDSLEDYLSAWSRIHDIVRAEAILRNCRLFIAEGRSINAPLELSEGPLIGPDDSLLAAS